MAYRSCRMMMMMMMSLWTMWKEEKSVVIYVSGKSCSEESEVLCGGK